MPPDPPMSHWGYLRLDDDPWHPVCCARSEDECWDLLLAHDTGRARRIERLVLPRGRRPEERRA